MENLLAEINKKVRDSKPNIDKANLYAVWVENKTLQIFIRSQGCRFSKMGMCTMCDYGVSDRNLTFNETAIAMNYIIKKLTPDIHSIGLGALGSFFDTFEVPDENRKYILKTIACLNIQDITIETYYTTVTPEIMKEAREILSKKDLSIEMGLESVDEYVQQHCLNKIIHLPTLLDKINLVHQYGCGVILNVLFGAPFLSLEQQIQDSLNSVIWGFTHGADLITLFPVNIKPYTLLRELFQAGYYEPVSQWGFLMLLNEIPEEYLNRISFSWYGNRESNYAEEGLEHIMPRACGECNGKIIDFYEKFLELPSARERKKLIQEMLKTSFSCSCREEEIERRKKDTYHTALKEEALQYLGKKYHVL